MIGLSRCNFARRLAGRLVSRPPTRLAQSAPNDIVGPFGPRSRSCGRKSAADEIEIGEREQREHLGAVLGDASIADLAIAELAFDEAELVLDLRANLA